MADFMRVDLHGSRFERVDLSGAELFAVDLAGARFRGVDLSGVVMRGVELVNVDVHGEIVNMTVNGVDIGPLIEAELDRRYPDRAKMRPADPAGGPRVPTDRPQRGVGAPPVRRARPAGPRGTQRDTGAIVRHLGYPGGHAAVAGSGAPQDRAGTRR